MPDRTHPVIVQFCFVAMTSLAQGFMIPICHEQIILRTVDRNNVIHAGDPDVMIDAR